MSITTILLIILFFVVLAIKPTYLLTYRKGENINYFVFKQTPLIIALTFKILFWNNIQILTSKQYNFALNLYNQKIKELE